MRRRLLVELEELGDRRAPVASNPAAFIVVSYLLRTPFETMRGKATASVAVGLRNKLGYVTPFKREQGSVVGSNAI
jgi:hypothetical protein